VLFTNHDVNDNNNNGDPKYELIELTATDFSNVSSPSSSSPPPLLSMVVEVIIPAMMKSPPPSLFQNGNHTHSYTGRNVKSGDEQVLFVRCSAVFATDGGSSSSSGGGDDNLNELLIDGMDFLAAEVELNSGNNDLKGGDSRVSGGNSAEDRHYNDGGGDMGSDIHVSAQRQQEQQQWQGGGNDNPQYPHPGGNNNPQRQQEQQGSSRGLYILVIHFLTKIALLVLMLVVLVTTTTTSTSSSSSGMAEYQGDGRGLPTTTTTRGVIITPDITPRGVMSLVSSCENNSSHTAFATDEKQPARFWHKFRRKRRAAAAAAATISPPPGPTYTPPPPSSSSFSTAAVVSSSMLNVRTLFIAALALMAVYQVVLFVSQVARHVRARRVLQQQQQQRGGVNGSRSSGGSSSENEWKEGAATTTTSTTSATALTVLVHAYNSWGFCGAVRQGEAMPFYGMPSTFVQAFHDGSPALAINARAVPWSAGLAIWRLLKLPWSLVRHRNFSTSPPEHAREDKDGGIIPPPHIASDMYTVLADERSRYALVCGFLSQRQQFGCIAFDRSYRHMLVRVACDGVVLGPGLASIGIGGGSASNNKKTNNTVSTNADDPVAIRTDWLWLEAVTSVDEGDPLGMYMTAAGEFNRAKTVLPHFCHPPHQHQQLGSSSISANSSQTTTVIDAAIGAVANVNSSSVSPLSRYGDEEIESELDLASTTNNNSSVKQPPRTPPSGWCSWYHFFEKVTEADLVENVSLMRDLKEHHGLHAPRLGFSLFQVDDGYQVSWGDWLKLDRKKFPSGSLSTIVDLVQGAGMTAGLWMAPFSADKGSALAANHPEWLLRNTRGVPANSANCGKFFYGLDTTHPGVQQHIRQCISTITKKWGFSYLKLDFLYSAILADSSEACYDRTKTRAQKLCAAMDLINDTLADEKQQVCVLGCGSPLGAMIGHVHCNRVSPDAGLSWLPEMPLPQWDKWNLPSARSMLRNSLSRMSQHGRWWTNDPDCMLLRDKGTTFSEDEIISILTVKALSGGSFILSDDLSLVPPHRLRYAQQVRILFYSSSFFLFCLCLSLSYQYFIAARLHSLTRI
jgi:alpha-galactosidase